MKIYLENCICKLIEAQEEVGGKSARHLGCFANKSSFHFSGIME